MPRKPKRAAPEAGAKDGGSTAAKGSAGAKGTAGASKTAGARGSAGAGKSAGAKAMPGTRSDLSPLQVEAIRQLALDLARKGAGPDAVMICNPTSEPSALPAKELLYDRCRWCETDIYYDRLMPSPPDMMRVCLKCGILLLEAEKKGKN